MLDREYKQMYADIKPDGLLIAEVKEKMKKGQDLKKASCRKILLWCGSAAAVIVVVTMTITTLWHGGSPIDTGKNTSAISSFGGSESGADFDPVAEPVIPDWYQPGKLNVLSLLKKKNLTGVSAETKTELIQPLGVHLTGDSLVPLTETKDTALTPPDGYQYSGNALIGDRFISLYTTNQTDTHFGCNGIYYDVRQKTITCFSHQAKEMLSKVGMLTKDSVINILMVNPFNGNCLVRTRDDTKKTSYIYACNADGSVEKADLPNKYSCGMFATVNSDHSYGALSITRETDDFSRVWVVDLSGEKITVKKISEVNGVDYRTGEDLRFTPNDRYLIYNIVAENGKLYHFNAREQWFAYDTQTGTSVRGSGKFLRYIQDGNAAILETTSGGKVVDLSSGKDLTNSADLQDWEKMQVVEMSVRSASYGYLKEITLENVFDSKQERVTVRKQVSNYLEKDGYIYSYLHGENSIECYSIQTGEKFTVPVSQKLLNEIASYGEKYQFDYSVSLNKDGTTVFLSYYAEQKQPEPETESTSENIVLSFRDANSLSDMENFIRKNFKTTLHPSDTEEEISPELAGIGVVRAEAQFMLGDGYSAVVLRDSYGHYKVVVEDYRDNSFTMYQYDDSLDSVFAVYDDPSLPASIKFRKPLSAGANQSATKTQYNDLPPVEQMYDYATLYTKGKLDSNKVFRAVFNRMVDKKLVTQFSIGAFTDLQGERGAYGYEDKTCVYSILKVLAKHDQFYSQNYNLFWNQKKMKETDPRYWIVCSVGDYSRDIILGRDSNNKPFICYSDAYYFYISEQEYTELTKECKETVEKAKQAHQSAKTVR